MIDPPETPDNMSTYSNSEPVLPSTRTDVAAISLATPKPYAAAREPPPENVSPIMMPSRATSGSEARSAPARAFGSLTPGRFCGGCGAGLFAKAMAGASARWFSG